jgi:hypothetical protein
MVVSSPSVARDPSCETNQHHPSGLGNPRANHMRGTLLRRGTAVQFGRLGGNFSVEDRAPKHDTSKVKIELPRLRIAEVEFRNPPKTSTFAAPPRSTNTDPGPLPGCTKPRKARLNVVRQFISIKISLALILRVTETRRRAFPRVGNNGAVGVIHHLRPAVLPLLAIVNRSKGFYCPPHQVKCMTERVKSFILSAHAS